ncbi:protein adenylyltransferase SelO family protein [Marinobacter sp.]|uniref:protein adenylyltransferase SelO family protein n=1 Tax=Marinobacter sp. TaxID=50741 RepID=UPI00356AC7CB
MIPAESEGLKVVSMAMFAGDDQPAVLRGPMVGKYLNMFVGGVEWGTLDYLLLDLPPGTGDVQLTLAQNMPLSGVVIVTTPQAVSLKIARRGLRMFEKVQVRTLGLRGGGEAMSEELGVPFLGALPLDADVVTCGDEGRPIVAAQPASMTAAVYSDIASGLVNQLLGAEAVLKPYGDGRAISVLEAVLNGRRWEMQLKGGGRTPYCRGADGRAVLRSSVREFLAQEHMHALGVPTSRSLSLYVSKTEKVRRPWYSEGSHARDPDQLIPEPVAISTRVAPSFIRVGQLELFGRRARKQEHPRALEELEQLVLHLMDREYNGDIDQTLATPTKIVMLARAFRSRLASLVANWIRVGYCQGNFNSDNCAAGGFTLDYGPFGFCEIFEPFYQPWTGGGQHFAFLNQPAAAEQNFKSFCSALRPLLGAHEDELAQLEAIERGFPEVMQAEMRRMWSAKLGLEAFDVELFRELMMLMTQTPVDYTVFFHEFSSLPDDIWHHLSSSNGQKIILHG